MDNVFDMLKQPPEAAAYIKGSRKYPNICGRVLFYTVGNAVLVRSEIMGLPEKAQNAKVRCLLFTFTEETPTQALRKTRSRMPVCIIIPITVRTLTTQGISRRFSG